MCGFCDASSLTRRGLLSGALASTAAAAALPILPSWAQSASPPPRRLAGSPARLLYRRAQAHVLDTASA